MTKRRSNEKGYNDNEHQHNNNKQIKIMNDSDAANNGNNNNNNNKGTRRRRESSLLDPDTTLPLPDDVQAEYDSQKQLQTTMNNNNMMMNDDDDNSKGNENGEGEYLFATATTTTSSSSMPCASEQAASIIAEGKRLLALLTLARSNNGGSTTTTIMSDGDAAALLTCLTRLRQFPMLFFDNNNTTNNNNDENDGSLCKTTNNNLGFQIIKASLQAAMSSLTTLNSTAHGGVSSGASLLPGSAPVITMDAITAKRILTDGILPFASSSSSSSSFSNTTNDNTDNNNGSILQEALQESAQGAQHQTRNTNNWIGKLISSITIHDLLPTAVMAVMVPSPNNDNNDTHDDNSNASDKNGNDSNSNEKSAMNSTTALEILLPSFLARMDSDETASYPNDVEECNYCSVDSILDALCCVPNSTLNTNSNSNSTTALSSSLILASAKTTMPMMQPGKSTRLHRGGLPTTSNNSKNSSNNNNNNSINKLVYKLRPHATAAILASMRELETILPGRLSRVRKWRCNTKNGGMMEDIANNSSDNNSNSDGNNNKYRECHYQYIDRPTHLAKAALSSLSQLSGNESQDPDALPPLVYQLGLLPMGLLRGCETLSSISSSGGSGPTTIGGGENGKQRGKRIRCLCLEGIANVLEDAKFDLFRNDNNYGTRMIVGVGDGSHGSGSVVLYSNQKDKTTTTTTTTTTTRNKSKDSKQQHYEEAWRWARYTSLSHLGSCLRSDPEMTKAVLSMLGGEIDGSTNSNRNNNSSSSSSSGNMAPFRYQRLTPFKLAMGLSMASSVPRMRSLALGTLRDLIMEEETIRIRCGRGVNGNVIGMGRPWMNCLVRCLEMGCNKEEEEAKTEFKGLSHVLRSLLSVAKFAESSEHGGGAGSGGGGGGGGGGCASSLLQSLLSLGFLLVDAVKKDEPIGSSSSSNQASSILAPSLDVSSLDDTRCSSLADTSAPHATARIGRFLLCFLFYQSAAASSHFLSSSLSSMSNGTSSSDGGTALCRSILRLAIDRFCGMSPNSLEHARLLMDLVRFSPCSLKPLMAKGNVNHDELTDKQKDEVISLALASHHLQPLIECLANVPGGGLSPTVASTAIVPAVESLLLLQASARPGLAGYLWKKRDIEDHIDHAFLLAKKSLFCADIDKRKSAATLLVTLIGVASVASSSNDARAAAIWVPMIDEMRGCLRRCITQHQPPVRMEAYSSLVALLPTSAIAAAGSTQTQDSVSPASTVSGGATTPVRSSGAMSRATVSPAGQKSAIHIVSDILLSQLERYVTTPKEDLRYREARRKRAANIGSQLSQMEVMDEEESPDGFKGIPGDKSMPFRFEMCISTRSSNRVNNKSKGGKSKKSLPIGQTLLAEATSRINEPLDFLIASSLSVTTIDNQGELKKALDQIRLRMAGCSDIEEYLKWIKGRKEVFEITDNAKRAEEMEIGKLATLVLVAAVAEVLMGTCEWSEGNGIEVIGSSESTNEVVESLFNLRYDAISRAAEIMSSFVSSKSKKPARATKKLKNVDMNSQQSQPSTDNIKSSKASVVKSNEINPATLARNQKLVEDAIFGMCPAMPPGFLSTSLRKFGALVSTSYKTNVENSEDEDDDEAAALRLGKSMTFRRFVITKTLLLLSGRSSVINPGARFCSTPSNPIAAYMSLGPLLFAEFCAHCYDCEQTSIAPKNSSSFQASDLSLTQLALRAFSFCVHGMTNGTMNHAMSKAQRVHFLMSNSIMTASRATPSSKDGWDYYKALDSDAARIHGIDVSHDELQLQRTLLPFVSYNASPAEGNGDSPTRICLFAELLQESMHGECVEFCHLVMAAANAFSEPNIREHLGIMMLRCFEHRKGEEVVGVLGLDHGEDSRADACSSVSSAIKVAFRLNHDLDGDAVVPIPLDFLGLDLKRKGSLRVARSKMGLPCFTLDNWPEKHRERLVKELSSSDGCPGTVQQVAWALTGTLGIDTPFIKLFSGRESPLSKQVKLACIKTASKLPEPIFAKEKTSISNMISAAIESGLNNADYVTLKLIPHMSGNSLDFAQRFVSCLLMSVSKVICASAPSAAYVDINGSFASTLLKSTKKLYGVLARLILSYSNNPQSLASKENISFFDYVSSTLMSRVAALLYTIQEKHETSVGKFLAESKIESHGKISALLVFEKEKLDNALLKVGARLKQAGFEDDSEWLEEHVVASLNRDFDIKKGDIQNAKEREAPKKKRNPAEKRKAKPKSSPKKKKKVKKEKNETPVAEVISSDVEEDDIADGGDASSDGDDGFESEGGDVVSLGNLTNDMGDDDDCSDEDMEDGDDCEEDSESEDELESD